MIMNYLFVYYLFFSSVIFFINFFYFYINKMMIFVEILLVSVSSIKLEVLFLFDWVSLLFVSVVLLISSMVIFYSMEYMSMDLNINRFMYLVILFVLSMMLMILSPNMMSILFGWDGLGLVSYCLVIYYQGEKSFNSGMITVLTNRVGDIIILMVIGLMVYLGSWNFMNFFKLDNLLMYMLLIAAITKSAQIPFSSWLPLAMAAPTPVSSLVHSSTLVTAGVYLLIRFNFLMQSNEGLMKFMMILSLITMFLAGLGANFEYDLKKIIALSTLSQLGVMIFSLSLGLYEVTLFHLVTHAMFKSMLFMCAGVIIHNMMGYQDIRIISMVSLNMPMISMFFNCSTMSLCGLPFLSGFFSKDLILELYLMSELNAFLVKLLFLSMGLTVMYSFRLISYSFIKSPNLIFYTDYIGYKSKMGISMYILFFSSILLGTSLSWILFSSKNIIYLNSDLKLMIYTYMTLGMFMGLTLPYLFFQIKSLIKMNSQLKFFMSLWFMPLLYGFNTFKMIMFAEMIIRWADLGWNEYLVSIVIFLYLSIFFKLDYSMKKIILLLLFISYVMIIILLI